MNNTERDLMVVSKKSKGWKGGWIKVKSECERVNDVSDRRE